MGGIRSKFASDTDTQSWALRVIDVDKVGGKSEDAFFERKDFTRKRRERDRISQAMT